MASEKIGIITCSNAANDLDCCAAPCLHDLNKRLGKFKDYSSESSLRLAGIITCPGCPTLAYPEKIMRKVNALANFKVTSIHFSFCMVALCPFLNKYIEIIGKAYPDIKLIKGTHEEHYTYEQFRENVKSAFDKKLKMNDLIFGKGTFADGSNT
jgi:predicted metal-binding protein